MRVNNRQLSIVYRQFNMYNSLPRLAVFIETNQAQISYLNNEKIKSESRTKNLKTVRYGRALYENLPRLAYVQ